MRKGDHFAMKRKKVNGTCTDDGKCTREIDLRDRQVHGAYPPLGPIDNVQASMCGAFDIDCTCAIGAIIDVHREGKNNASLVPIENRGPAAYGSNRPRARPGILELFGTETLVRGTTSISITIMTLIPDSIAISIFQTFSVRLGARKSDVGGIHHVCGSMGHFAALVARTLA